MKRIGTVKQTIVGLANMFGDDVSTKSCSTWWTAEEMAGSRGLPAGAAWY